MRYSVRNVLLYSFKISHEDREGLWILNTYSFWLLTWNLFLHSKGYLKITAAVQAPGDKLPVCSATIFFFTDCSFYKYQIPVSKWSKSQKQRQLQSRERARGGGLSPFNSRPNWGPTLFKHGKWLSKLVFRHAVW